MENDRDENVSSGILFAGVTTLTGGLGILEVSDLTVNGVVIY
jgi:hypothetical protein